MNAGTVSDRIFDFCRILVGRMRGGLAQIDILVSVVFSGMSGSAIADAAGQFGHDQQMKPEYSPGFAGALSRPARRSDQSSRHQFRWLYMRWCLGHRWEHCFLPAWFLIVSAVLMIAVHIIATHRNMPREDPIPLSEWPNILFRGALPLSLPVVLLTGIYSGVFYADRSCRRGCTARPDSGGCRLSGAD